MFTLIQLLLEQYEIEETNKLALIHGKYIAFLPFHQKVLDWMN